MEVLVKLHNLQCSRNEVPLFKPINLDVHGSSLIQITGPNGIGKSTLLKTLSGLIEPYSGCVRHMNSCELFYVGHESHLHPGLSVRQNLEYYCYLREITFHSIANNLCRWEILHLLETQANLLSAGQIQKVKLCMLISNQNSVWVLDEPLSNLDNNSKKILYAIMQEQIKNLGSIITATHTNFEFACENYQELNLNEYLAA